MHSIGRGIDYRRVGEHFRATVKRAGITAPGRLPRLPPPRLASMLISNGLNVVFVSRQFGHANPNITLSTYAHLWGKQTTRRPRARHSKQATQR